ncbi:MAG: phosphotransferase [Bacteroidetes bacterium]|nr:phosphotransferase [Bacteroidota bacterium]
MHNIIKEKLISLFEKQTLEQVGSISELPSSGSYRQYFRLRNNNRSVLGAYNNDAKENNAFITFSKHFKYKGLPVPEIFAKDEENHIYLLEDLGDTTLFSYLSALKQHEENPDEIIKIYKKIIDFLPKFQVNASTDLDYSVCYPRANFDKQSMLWDLNYFKYYFLKLAKISFDEQKLEDDFQSFSDFLLKTDCNFFLYRDFQSRNIMLKHEQPYFIDYQGGRKGALQYDIASLLYDAKADLSQKTRNILFDYYLDVLKKYLEIDKKEFTTYYYGYVLIRIMQALGAYGFRGFYEKKEHFLQSIPYALDNLTWLLENTEIPLKIPTLMNVLHKISQSEMLRSYAKNEAVLKVSITSFAYKNGIPNDDSGNGGGFVFDCRALHNPGRYEEYKTLTGKDKEVISFLKKEPEMYEFLNHAYRLIDITVENYVKRKFANLMVNFGCTGGQHRSVFCANMLADHLKNKFDIKIEVYHRELEK